MGISGEAVRLLDWACCGICRSPVVNLDSLVAKRENTMRKKTGKSTIGRGSKPTKKRPTKKKMTKGYAEGGKVKKDSSPFGLFGKATAAARKRKLEQDKKSRGD